MTGFYDPDERDDEHLERRCRYCGERGLHWEEHDYARWLLVDERGVTHVCPKPEPKFDPVL